MCKILKYAMNGSGIGCLLIAIMCFTMTSHFTMGYLSSYLLAVLRYSFARFRLNPTGEHRFDGISLHPYDAMFMKMKSVTVQARTPMATNVIRYQQWLSASVSKYLCSCIHCCQASVAGKRFAKMLFTILYICPLGIETLLTFKHDISDQ